MTKFSNKMTNELLIDYWDEESFSNVVEEVVRRTVLQCATRVKEYSEQRQPASTYATMLENEIN